MKPYITNAIYNSTIKPGKAKKCMLKGLIRVSKKVVGKSFDPNSKYKFIVLIKRIK